MSSNKSVTATFTQIQYTLNVTATNGSVTAPTDGNPHTYNCSEVVDLLAEPDLGYEFVGWSGDTTTIVNPDSPSTTITMNGSKTVQANFGLLPPSRQLQRRQ